MNEKEFNARVARLEQVGEVLKKLPTEVRSDAFALLKGYVTGHNPSNSPDTESTASLDESAGSSDIGSLFTKFEHDKPSDNVRLIAASFYHQYGVEPFSIAEVRERANEVGITIPNRPDMTLKGAVEAGKNLFTSAGKGKYKPTVHGEQYLKSTYSVIRGKKKRSEDIA